MSLILFIWISCGIIVWIKTVKDGYNYPAYRVILAVFPTPLILGPIGFIIYELTKNKKILAHSLNLINNRYKLIDLD